MPNTPEYSRDYYTKTKQHHHELVRAWRARNPERTRELGRNGNLKRKYGLTPEAYTAMYEAQEGKCAICGEYQELLAVDHDHNTDKIRELLCRSCNSALGFMEHPMRPQWEAYLAQHGGTAEKRDA